MDNEKQCKLEFLRNEFQIAQAYVSYWHAMALTGVAAQRKMQRMQDGVPHGPDAWVNLTPEEKTKEALDTMERHIRRMAEVQQEINKLIKE